MALTKEEIVNFKIGGQKLVEILDTLVDSAVPGANLLDLDRLAGDLARATGGTPSFRGYQGYPANCCLSVNAGVVHCIPVDYVLQEGDLLSIDMGLYYKGLHTDSTISLPVGGEMTPEVEKLLRATYSALRAGVAEVRPNVRVVDISKAIEETLQKQGITIFKEFVGHQVGHELHEGILIPNHVEKGYGSAIIREGMGLAIEPITGLGSPKVLFEADGWTTRTADGKPAAQYEETVLVTSEGVEIITPIENIVRKLKIS